MISRTRTRVVAVFARASRFSSNVVGTRTAELDNRPEPYGLEYGAGPSRLPYDPSPQETNVSSLRRQSHTSVTALRKALRQLPHGAYSTPATLLKTLRVEARSLSLLERHVILHHVIRVKGEIAVGLACHFLDQAEGRPQRVYSMRTLAALGDPRLDRTLKGCFRAAGTPVEGQPTIEQQRASRISKQLARLLELFERLYAIRHPRPESLYHLVINQCARERRIDLAANVYVGLVEEWIIEGRIAEGANPEDFYPGGGPPRTRLPATTTSGQKLRMWFTGVRTWRLPGEAISPHERQDLWHPKHLSTHEKLRGWPLVNPTSPPSLVPHPNLSLLYPILNHLAHDHKAVDPQEYAASMRAIATLANTVLNRTLPVPAVPQLLKAFSSSRTFPVVYPEDYDKAPEKNAWAFTANTQVHVALVSLLFSPPNYAAAYEFQQQVVTPRKLLPPANPPLANPTKGDPAAYMLGPLGWQSSMVLVQYVVEQLRQPRLLNRLFTYMRSRWDFTSPPKMFNKVFRLSTKQRDNEMAEKVEDLLFGDSPFRREAAEQGQQVVPNTQLPQTEDLTTLSDMSFEDQNLAVPQADEYSLAALVLHLTATSQFDRLEKIVNLVIPYLSVSRHTPQGQIDALTSCIGDELIGYTGRLRPTELNAHLYSVIVNGLAKGGYTGLAQRVFRLAKSFENRDIRRSRWEKTDIPKAAHYRLSVSTFTSMIQLYGAEARRTNSEKQFPRGWRMEGAPQGVTRQQQGEVMVWRTYEQTMGRWYELVEIQDQVERKLLINSVPDARFFNATIKALKNRWELTSDTQLQRGRLLELEKVCTDMADLGIDPPLGLLYKVKNGDANGHGIFLAMSNDGKHNLPRPVHRRVYTPTRRLMDRTEADGSNGRYHVTETDTTSIA